MRNEKNQHIWWVGIIYRILPYAALTLQMAFHDARLSLGRCRRYELMIHIYLGTPLLEVIVHKIIKFFLFDAFFIKSTTKNLILKYLLYFQNHENELKY